MDLSGLSLPRPLARRPVKVLVHPVSEVVLSYRSDTSHTSPSTSSETNSCQSSRLSFPAECRSSCRPNACQSTPHVLVHIIASSLLSVLLEATSHLFRPALPNAGIKLPGGDKAADADPSTFA